MTLVPWANYCVVIPHGNFKLATSLPQVCSNLVPSLQLACKLVVCLYSSRHALIELILVPWVNLCVVIPYLKKIKLATRLLQACSNLVPSSQLAGKLVVCLYSSRHALIELIWSHGLISVLSFLIKKKKLATRLQQAWSNLVPSLQVAGKLVVCLYSSRYALIELIMVPWVNLCVVIPYKKKLKLATSLKQSCSLFASCRQARTLLVQF